MFKTLTLSIITICELYPVQSQAPELVDPIIIPPQLQPPINTEAPPIAPIMTQPPPAGFAWGAYNQLCPISGNSVHMYNQCQSSTDIAVDTRGILFCERTAGCCMCSSIQCGFGTTPCKELSFGNFAAKFVGDIQVRGDPNSGAVITCNGIEACIGATITGTNIAVIDCDAARSCQFAKIRITDPTQHFLIECGAPNACDGMEIEINLSGPPPGYQCAHAADPRVSKPIFVMSGIECGAESACNLLDITINNESGCYAVNVQIVECLEPNSCNGAVFDLIGDINIQSCLCGASCNNAVGLGSCYIAPSGTHP